MTANRKGKVVIATIVGLISRYLAIPYESIIIWNSSVSLFVRWNVGGSLPVLKLFIIGMALDPPDDVSPIFLNAAWTLLKSFCGSHASAIRHFLAGSYSKRFMVW